MNVLVALSEFRTNIKENICNVLVDIYKQQNNNELPNWEELEDIVQSCKDIFDLYNENGEDNSKAIALAKELLPTTSDCCFGSNKYDEYYFNDLEDVQYKIEKFLGELEEDESIFVIMSW